MRVFNELTAFLAAAALCGGILAFAGASRAAEGPAPAPPAPAGAIAAALEPIAEYLLEMKTTTPKVADEWVYASETSAAVYWRTDVPAETWVEYGSDEKCSLKTEPDGSSKVTGRPFFSHLHRLTGLQTGKACCYRTVSKSADGKVSRGEVKTLTTKKLAGAIPVPGELQGPPYVLDKEGATYVLTKDVTADGAAIDIKAGGITLDLDGHTVVYNEKPKTDFDMTSFNAHIKEGVFGLLIRGPQTKVTVLNGVVRQGAAAQEGHDVSIGFNPVYCSGTPGFEIAGMTLEWSGRQVSGLVLHWGGVKANVHHNVLRDCGNLIADRHQTVSALKGYQDGSSIHHNLVARTRQCGIMSADKPEGSEVFANEIHVDSYSINSFALGLKDRIKCRNNLVFGCGCNCVAFGTTGGCEGVEVFENYVRLFGTDIRDRLGDTNKKEMESTDISVMSGPRVTWGCKSVDYHDNTIVVTGSGGAMIRGTFFFSEDKAPGVVFRKNTVAAIALDDTIAYSGAIATVGSHDPKAAPVTYEGNLVISNFACVNLGDSYGVGANCRFIGNTYRKIGSRPGFKTIRMPSGYASVGHVFIDSKFEGGAGYDSVAIRPDDNLSVGWTLTVKTVPGATVVVKDKSGKEVFSEAASAEGVARVQCVEYGLSGTNKTMMTPHTVTVKKDGAEKSAEVTVDSAKEVSLKP